MAQPLVASGSYDDGTRADLTAVAVWSSSDTTVAQVEGAGAARAVAVGSASVTAAVGGVSGRAALTVVAARLVSIQVTSLSTSLAVSDVQPLAAFGTWSDGAVRDVTTLASWTSSDPGVAAVSDAPGAKGLALGVAPGAAVVRARSGAIEGTAAVTVVPVAALDVWISNAEAPVIGDAAVDERGNALAVWAHAFTGKTFGTPPVLAAARYAADGGWGSAAPLDLGAIADVGVPTLAMNASGAGLLAWAGHEGVYATSYAPSTGWSTPRVLASGATPFGAFAQHLCVAVDAAGDGLAVWADANGDRVFGARYERRMDAWTAAQELPGANRGMAGSKLSLAMNASGAAVLVFERWSSGSPAWKVLASRFAPGSGWSSPDSLFQSESWTTPAVAMDGAGRIVATWVEYVADFPRASLHARRYLPARGWQPLDTLVAADPAGPADPAIAVNEAGAGAVVWRNAADATVKASLFTPSTGRWEPPRRPCGIRRTSEAIPPCCGRT
jgi:hypothetical protein